MIVLQSHFYRHGTSYRLILFLFTIFFRHETSYIIILIYNIHLPIDGEGTTVQSSLEICCYSTPESARQDGCSGRD
jgi:hypothetical protein